MTRCFFVSDLHGREDRYRELFAAVRNERPAAVLFGGDLLPSPLTTLQAVHDAPRDFVSGFLATECRKLRDALADDCPRLMLILGNDDARAEEAAVLEVAASGVWEYIHERKVRLGDFTVYGYACVPPTPFALKDWERYDLSRHVDVGCLSPEEGYRTTPMAGRSARSATIRQDLDELAADDPLDQAVFLFHAPPYQTHLDRAALDGETIDHVPLDVHVGSIAVRRFIELRQPRVTLHGHIHESPRLTGSWTDRIGGTTCLSAAHDGPELALVRFDLEAPGAATRELIPCE